MLKFIKGHIYFGLLSPSEREPDNKAQAVTQQMSDLQGL